MIKKFKAAAAAICLSSIFLLSACGNEPESYEVEYEGGDNEIIELGGLNGDNNEFGESGPDESESGYEEEEQPIYKIRFIDEDSINEEEIVKNFFGDSAIALQGPNMKELTDEKGENPIYERIFELNVKYGTGADTQFTDKIDSWKDGENYFAHVYEGKYRDTDYQLLIAYGKTTHIMYATLYPLNTGAIVGNEEFDQLSYTYNDGMVLVGKAENTKWINVDDIKSAPNKTTLNEDQIINTVVETLDDKLGYGIDPNFVGLYSNYRFDGNDTLIEDDPSLVKSEILFYNNEALNELQYTSVIKNGYAVSIASGYDDISILSDHEFGLAGYSEDYGGFKIYYGSSFVKDISDRLVLVDNDGVIGFNLEYSYEIIDTEYETGTEFNDEVMRKYYYGGAVDPSTVDPDSLSYLQVVYYFKKSDKNEMEGELIPVFAFIKNNECFVIERNSGELLEQRFFNP